MQLLILQRPANLVDVIIKYYCLCAIKILKNCFHNFDL